MREIFPRCPFNGSTGDGTPTVLKNVSRFGSKSRSVNAAPETAEVIMVVPSGSLYTDGVNDDEEEEEEEDDEEEEEVLDEDVMLLLLQHCSFHLAATSKAPK